LVILGSMIITDNLWSLLWSFVLIKQGHKRYTFHGFTPRPVQRFTRFDIPRLALMLWTQVGYGVGTRWLHTLLFLKNIVYKSIADGWTQRSLFASSNKFATFSLPELFVTFSSQTGDHAYKLLHTNYYFFPICILKRPLLNKLNGNSQALIPNTWN